MAQFLFRGLRLCNTTVLSKTAVCCKCERNTLKLISYMQPSLASLLNKKLYSSLAEKKPAETLGTTRALDSLDIFGEDKDERRKEKEKAIKNLKIGFFFIGASLMMVLGSGLYVLMDDNYYKKDEDEKEIYPVCLFNRGRMAIRKFFESMRAPSYEKLLPDPLPYPKNQTHPTH